MPEQPLIAIVLRKIPLSTDQKGINATYKAVVRSREGDTAAIAKHIPEQEIGVECLCAMMGRAAGLQIPRPMVLMDAELGLMYGGEELPHPDLKHAGFDAAKLAQLFLNWEKLPESSAFDEWIANPDRHGGNLLTDSLDIWLIDHGLALGAAIAKDSHVNNYLLDIAAGLADNDIKKQRLMKKLSAFVNKTNNLGLPGTDGLINEDMVNFLRARKLSLFTLLRKKVLNHDELPGL